MTHDAHHADTPDRTLRDAIVRAGWAEALILERLGPDTSRELLADHLAAQVEHARASLKPLTPWPAQPERVTKVLAGDGNQVRIRRTLDYLMPGDRVLEVGVGFGQLSGLMMRDCGIAAYTGIDIGQHRLDAVHQMAQHNGLDHLDIETALVDLTDLTPEWVRHRGTNLILVAEVLEHVPDAEAALAAIGRSMGPGCCVLFTVPVLGRIEACWGHLSLFDTARVQRMITDAGLVTQHVEVVYDAWLFILAAPTPAVPERVLHLTTRARPAPPPPPPAVPTFIPVALDTARATGAARAVEVTTDKEGAHVRVSGRRGRGRQHGGITFTIAGDIALRFELGIPDPAKIQRVTVALRDTRGHRTAAWTWNPDHAKITARKPRTFVLKPGEPYGPFRPDGDATGEPATTAEILVELSGGDSTTFTIRRAAAVEARTSG